MDDQQKYDNALLGILQNEGKIEKFLNVIFGFLYRRTDFYRIMKSKQDRLGFPPGISLKMVTNIFQQYDALTRQDDQIREARMQQPEPKFVALTEKSENEEQTIAAPENKKQSDILNTNSSSTKEDIPVDMQTTQSANKVVERDTSANSDRHSDNVQENKSTETNSKSNNSKTKSGEEDDELTRQQMKFQANPESYNGAERENYNWSQSITDLDLRVKVPAYIRKGRDVKVDIKKKHVMVSHKDENGQFNVVIDGDLTWEIQPDESMWTLNPGENVHINFEKKDERWWEAVLTDEPKINVRKIDASRPMTDLDDEAQAKIEEMMYNDRQKKLGLPTAKEQKMQDMLKNAWDAEGSPFKGQPFDPSKFTMDSNGVFNMKPS